MKHYTVICKDIDYSTFSATCLAGSLKEAIEIIEETYPTGIAMKAFKSQPIKNDVPAMKKVCENA